MEQGHEAEEREKHVEQFSKVGVCHEPKQFFNLAKQVAHPMGVKEHIEEATRFALNFNLQYPPHLIET